MTDGKASPEILLLRKLGINVEDRPGPMFDVVAKAFDRERLLAYRQGRDDEVALHRSRALLSSEDER